MCGRATLRIVLSTPCMMFASMIDIVIMPRFGTGVNASPLIDRPLNEPPAGPVALCPQPHCGKEDCVMFLAERRRNPVDWRSRLQANAENKPDIGCSGFEP